MLKNIFVMFIKSVFSNSSINLRALCNNMSSRLNMICQYLLQVVTLLYINVFNVNNATNSRHANIINQTAKMGSAYIYGPIESRIKHILYKKGFKNFDFSTFLTLLILSEPSIHVNWLIQNKKENKN